MASSTLITVSFRPAKSISLPTDLAEAAASTSHLPKPLSCNTCSITLPTIPVAPTTAIFMSGY
jgi:hypothetical protein